MVGLKPQKPLSTLIAPFQFVPAPPDTGLKHSAKVREYFSTDHSDCVPWGAARQGLEPGSSPMS